MAEVRTKLTKMKSADPRFVSLVKRGANRIPFRIIKTAGEDDMGIDLTSIGRQLAKKNDKTAKPTVVALVVEKAEDMDAVKKALTDAGFSVEKSEESEEGMVSFLQSEDTMEAGQIIRVSENLIAVAKHVDVKALTALKLEGAEDFVPGEDLATVAMKAEIDAAVASGDMDTVKKAADALAAHVKALKAALPEAVFTAAAALAEVAKAEATKKAEAKKADEDAEAARKAAEATNEGGAGADEDTGAGDDKGGEPTVAEQITKAMEGLLASIAEQITKALEPMASQVKELGDKVTEVATKAEAVEKTVKGTVAAGAPAGDNVQQPARKDEKDEDPRTGVFDTALIRKSARSRDLHR